MYLRAPPTTTQFWLVRDPSVTEPACAAKHHALAKHLAQYFPQARLSIVGGDPFTDFARLVYAPLLFRDCGSFGLWAAVANLNEVWSPPLPSGDTPFLGGDWHWSVAPMLTPATAGRYRLAHAKNDSGALVSWLLQH
eukprot:NODE_1181_length_1045_cov_272.047189_g815_i0.p1 GENE.NODE_1181_length_1045_cov_272.047189_g815_i0~~NODE_1181_length_1045_cov_272.047189_g815_i0.p1  ORF type:complete len:137 (-),score=41.77 NODE_1181_length_1045_cov_272.047189_g815_i0:74-484(-)